MPSLSDVLSSAKSQIKQNSASLANVKTTAGASLSSAKREVAGIVPSIIRNQSSTVSASANQAINTGLSAIKSAANSLVHGDLSGALNQISKGPTDILGSLAKSFGLSSGSSLFGPGPSGADPGNSLAGALARSDPLLSYEWYAIMPDVSPLNGSPTQLPWYYVEEATPPFRTFNVRSIYHQGRERHYPSTYSVDSLRLVIYADTAGVSMKYLKAWNGALMLPTSSTESSLSGGGYGRPTDYKKTIKIFLMDSTKTELMVLEYIGCWPTTMEAYTLDSGSSSRLLNTVTFSVDDVFVKLYNVTAF